MQQIEIIEVRFIARSVITKIEKTVSKWFGLSEGVEATWPPEIEYELVAVISGSINEEQRLATGISQYIEYAYKERYDRPRPTNGRVSMNDITSGILGSHNYYPIDLSDAQQYIMQFIASLGREGWELVSAPPALGAQQATFDVLVSPPHSSRWEFGGGGVIFYIGQSKSNPSGIAYSFQRRQSAPLPSPVTNGTQAVTDKRFCTHCGSPLLPSANFCAGCGNRVG